LKDAGARPRVVLVAAVARDRTIGKGGKIPWKYPGEQAHFKAVTMGTALVMGRGTYDSIGRPLPGRDNIVITRDPAALARCVGGIFAVGSLKEAIDLAARRGASTVSIAGGGRIYAEALPQADELILTEVPEDGGGDVHFPEVDPARWRETSRERRGAFEIVRYARRGAPHELRSP
jgi:dihydrofolate reductase